MATLSENIIQAISDFDSVKVAAGIPDGTPTKQYADYINGAITEWQPRPDWWDIEKMVNTGVLEWSGERIDHVRYGFVVSDSNNSTKLPSGYEFYLSDGSYYKTTSATVHTWDRTKDKDCSDGYKTRAVIVCKSADRDVAVSQRAFGYDGIDSLYVYFGDCNILSLLFGAIQADDSNRFVEAIQCSDSTTANSGAIGQYSLSNCCSLMNVILSNGVTSIGQNAFYYCYSLKSVTLPNTVTAISAYAFQHCFSLTNITIPNRITSIGPNAFHNCHSLTSITIPDSVISLSSYAFYTCTSLKSITLPNNVTSIIFNTFGSCYALANVTIPKSFNLSLTLDGTNSIRLSISSMENMIRNYADRTGQTALTLTLGETNLAKLSDEIKAIATAKNITLA